MAIRRNSRLAVFLLATTIAYAPAIIAAISHAETPIAEDEYEFHTSHRVNAHGDEFMSLAITSDGRQLAIGTEKGEVIIWGIPEAKILKRFVQGSPVHCVVALSDPRFIVAAGGPHLGPKETAVLRKWNIETGTFEEWQGPGDSSLITLATDPRSGLVAAGNSVGGVVVWDSLNGQVVSQRNLKDPIISLALIDRRLYLTTMSMEQIKKLDQDQDSSPSNSILTLAVDHLDQPPRKIFPDTPGRLWSDLIPSPDGRLIAGRFAESNGQHVAVLDAEKGRMIGNFADRAAAWTLDGRLVSFGPEAPAHMVRIDAKGQATATDLLKTGTWHSAGTPAHMSGQVVSPNGKMAWEVFQLGASLVECNLTTQAFTELYRIPALPYALDALERADHSGLLITGGDDGFVRVWNLSDLTLKREFHVTTGVPQGVALIAEGRYALFSSSSDKSATEVVLADLVSGEEKQLLKLTEPMVRVAALGDGFIYLQAGRLVMADAMTGATKSEFATNSKAAGFAVSPNGAWLAAVDDKGTLYCFEALTGKRIAVSSVPIKDASCLAITNDGQYVYTTEWLATLRRWDTRHNTSKELASVRGQARSLRVSADGRRIALGGNHRDVAVYDAKSGERIFYVQSEVSDFYMTNVWVSGDRLIFTADSGVLFDGLLER